MIVKECMHADAPATTTAALVEKGLHLRLQPPGIDIGVLHVTAKPGATRLSHSHEEKEADACRHQWRKGKKSHSMDSSHRSCISSSKDAALLVCRENKRERAPAGENHAFIFFPRPPLLFFFFFLFSFCPCDFLFFSRRAKISDDFPVFSFHKNVCFICIII